KNRSWLTWLHLRVLHAIEFCRTATLGGHLDRCRQCGHEAISFNSCRSRHCPKCRTNARDKWLTARSKELLPVRYVHVVFTLPHELSWLILHNKKVIYDLFVPHQCRHSAGDCGRPPASRRGDRFPQRASHLGPDPPASSARSLRDPLWWPIARSPALGPPSLPFLPARGRTPPRLSWQVRRRLEGRLSSRQAGVSRQPPPAGRGEGLCRVPATALS